jgi:hypothetical protein
VGIPRDMRSVVLALAVVAASGCGGGGSAPPPRLPHALGTELAAQADAVEASLARGDDCGAVAQAASLRRSVADAVAAGQVPAGLRAPLSRSVASLAGEIACTPAPPPPGPPGHADKGKPKKKHGHDHGPGGDQGDGGKD